MMCAEFDGVSSAASRGAGISLSGNKLRINNKISGSAVLTDGDARAREALPCRHERFLVM
jgi:hypothetical protein